MRGPVFNQLVENIRRDGVLTQIPAIYQEEVLSGNHRVLAAIKAGLEETDCIEILGTLSDGDRVEMIERERKVAIQLSHNSLVGEDDPNVLAKLYLSLPLEEKQYSGVTDEMLKIEPLDLASLNTGNVAYQELLLVFLPEEAGAFSELLKRFEKRGGKKAEGLVLVNAYADFERLFDTIVRTKTKQNIHNTAIAVRVMADLAAERLDQLEAEEAAAAESAAVAKEPESGKAAE